VAICFHEAKGAATSALGGMIVAIAYISGGSLAMRTRNLLKAFARTGLELISRRAFTSDVATAFPQTAERHRVLTMRAAAVSHFTFAEPSDNRLSPSDASFMHLVSLWTTVDRRASQRPFPRGCPPHNKNNLIHLLTQNGDDADRSVNPKRGSDQKGSEREPSLGPLLDEHAHGVRTSLDPFRRIGSIPVNADMTLRVMGRPDLRRGKVLTMPAVVAIAIFV
jgi:hypothetical protein